MTTPSGKEFLNPFIPMICPKCHFEQDDGRTECVACGVIFARIRQPADRKVAYPTEAGDNASETFSEGILKTLLLPRPVDPNTLVVGARALLLALLLIWSFSFLFASIESNAVGRSFMHLVNLAPYINDARALDLVLLGGVTGKEVADYHDWEYLLRTTGLLKMDHALAWLAQGTGIVLMIAALLWMALNVWTQYKACRTATTATTTRRQRF